MADFCNTVEKRFLSIFIRSKSIGHGDVQTRWSALAVRRTGATSYAIIVWIYATYRLRPIGDAAGIIEA